MPGPYDVRPVAGFHPWRWIITGLIAIVLVFVAFFTTIPVLFEYLPGPAPAAGRLIEISGARTYSSEGKFLITTVSVDTEVTFAEWVGSAFDPTKAVVSRDQVTGGQSLEQLQRDQEAQMDESNRQAQEVALSALGLATATGDGARIRETLEGSPAAEVLEPGDLIVQVDGQKVETVCDVGRLIDEHAVGEEVSVTYKRDGKVRTATIGTIPSDEDPGAPIIGILMEEVNYEFDPGVKVKLDPGEIAGPSAGLMFSLEIYDRLTPSDLTGGRKVAGTGTISCDGGVGPIGGVEQKVAGAEQAGAEIFLAPAANFEAARSAAGDIEVVEISNFAEALEYLEGSN